MNERFQARQILGQAVNSLNTILIVEYNNP